MNNQLKPGIVKYLMEQTRLRRERLKTKEGKMEVVYEMLGDGDITLDQFNLISAHISNGTDNTASRYGN